MSGIEAQIAEADRLGFDSIWTAEAYGSDCFTPLAWWGAATRNVRLGTAITQMSARTPSATAMTAITLDHLSGGRFVLGLGASGPQVVEGWYGQAYPRPLARTREYIEIVREIVARQKPVEYHGDFYELPHAGGTGLGKAERRAEAEAQLGRLQPGRPRAPAIAAAPVPAIGTGATTVGTMPGMTTGGGEP